MTQRQLQRQLSQEDTTVSNTNPGLQDNQQQHVRETQQQLARPGQHRQHLASQGQQYIDHQLRTFDGSSSNIHVDHDQVALYIAQHGGNTTIRPSKISGNRKESNNPNMGYIPGFNPASSAENDKLFGLAGKENYGMMQHEGEGKEVCSGLSRSLNTEYNEKRQAIFDNSGNFPSRPCTPPSQSSSRRSSRVQELTEYYDRVSDCYPMTPAATPFNRASKSSASHRGSMDFGGLEGDETIKPARPQKGLCKDLFGGDGSHDVNTGFPSPPPTVPRAQHLTFDAAPMPSPAFMNMSSLQMDFSGSERGYDSSYYSPMSSAISPSLGSFQSSPDLAHMALFESNMEDYGDPRGSLKMSLSSQTLQEFDDGNSSRGGARSSRTMSITDLDFDATIEDTGITVDDIATFIEGPDPVDNKWICVFPECNKRFGRKENIKSHVQTHLGDRQFRCNHCQKCFVRQHDLKRHAKIHSGVKPYPCRCGNSFARHDALTRHRQRGMCVGAFEGVVKKVVKRGRPRKNRPDDEARASKASRTRRKVACYASSMSGESQDSLGQSPSATYESAESRAQSPLGRPAADLRQDSAQNAFQFTPPASPGHDIGTFVSLEQMHSSSIETAPGMSRSSTKQSIASSQEVSASFQPESGSPSKRGGSQYSTPPELCLASSSPPSSKFFDLEGATDAGLSLDHQMSEKMGLGSGNSNVAGEMNFDFTIDGAMTALEKDPMLLFGKFDDNTWSTDNLLHEDFPGSDMFFGSP